MARNFKIKKDVPKYIDKKKRLHSKKLEPQVTKKMKTRSFQTLLSKNPANYSEQDIQILNSYIDLYNSGYSCSQLGFGTQIPGDMNQDGINNVLDLISMVVSITNPVDDFPCLQTIKGDINQDGTLDILDVIIGVNMILSNEEPNISDYTSGGIDTNVDGFVIRYTIPPAGPDTPYYSCLGEMVHQPSEPDYGENASTACSRFLTNSTDLQQFQYEAIPLGQIADEVCTNEYYNFEDDPQDNLPPAWWSNMDAYACVRSNNL